jgi:uncharacterized membrane protein
VIVAAAAPSVAVVFLVEAASSVCLAVPTSVGVLGLLVTTTCTSVVVVIVASVAIVVVVVVIAIVLLIVSGGGRLH